MADDRLNELRAIYTHPHLHPGPWADDGGYRVFAPATAAEQDAGLGAEVVLCECKILNGTGADNAAMAAARTAVPALLAEVDRLRAALAAETERCAGIAERISEPGCGCAECEAVAVAVARIRGGRPR